MVFPVAVTGLRFEREHVAGRQFLLEPSESDFARCRREGQPAGGSGQHVRGGHRLVDVGRHGAHLVGAGPVGGIRHLQRVDRDARQPGAGAEIGDVADVLDRRHGAAGHEHQVLGAFDAAQRVDEVTQLRDRGVGPFAGVGGGLVRLRLHLPGTARRLPVALAGDDLRQHFLASRRLGLDRLVATDDPRAEHRAIGADGQPDPALELLTIFAKPQGCRRLGQRPQRHAVARRQVVDELRGRLQHLLAFAGVDVIAVDDQHESAARGGVHGGRGRVLGFRVEGVGGRRARRLHAPQRHNRPRLAVHEQREVLGLQRGHRLAAPGEHRHVDGDEIDAGSERRRLLRRNLGRRLRSGRLAGEGQHGRGGQHGGCLQRAKSGHARLRGRK